MASCTKEFLLKRIQQKRPIGAGIDPENFDFLKSGHIDSMGVMRFVIDIEKEFDIELTDDEIASSQFRTIAGLSAMIDAKTS